MRIYRGGTLHSTVEKNGYQGAGVLDVVTPYDPFLEIIGFALRFLVNRINVLNCED
jgi:hypothetical protein